MADQDELYYLQPGFDLASLTVPRIRSILVAHDVPYSSSAKKQDLLDLLQQQIIPKSRKLLNAQAKVKRTSRGITDVPSSQEDPGSDIDAHRMPPPPTPKTPRSRKSKTNLIEGGSSVPTPRTARKSRTPSDRRNMKTQQSDTESAPDTTVVKMKRPRERVPNETTAGHSVVKIEEPNKNFTYRSLASGESPFSSENPFQSGSSPPSGSKRISSTSRSRKSTGEKGRRSTSRRSETLSPEIKREDTENRRSTYEIPVERIDIDRNGVEATEEFTTDAKHELNEDLRSDKRLVRTRDSALTRHPRRSISTAARTAPFVVLLSVLTAIGGWYRQEKINIGYCGVGETDWSLVSNPNIPSWVHQNLQPQCEPCPPHATCFPSMKLHCDSDYVLRPHPLNLNGLIPLPPICEPDSEKERRVKAVADKAIEELRERRATYECGDTAADSTSDHTTVTSEQTVVATKESETKLRIPEETLKKEVSKMRRKGMSVDEFEELWRGALDEIVSREEVEVLRDGSGRTLLSSKSLANLPFGCAFKRSIRRVISENRIPLAILILVVSSMAYARQRIRAYNQAKAQTPALVSMTLDRLATQAALQADGRVQEGFISVGQLRDDVLRNVFSARERERVWQRVRKIIEGNSNVRAATREGGKTGEWSRVWEWIGPVDFAPSPEGRRTSSFFNGQRVPENDNEMRKDATARKWDEGQPIY